MKFNVGDKVKVVEEGYYNFTFTVKKIRWDSIDKEYEYYSDENTCWSERKLGFLTPLEELL